MTTLHMDTEQVREKSNQLNQQAEDFLASANTLSTVAGRLSNAWQGRQAESFTGNLRSLVKNLRSQADQLQTIAARTGRAADEWEGVDSQGATGIREEYEKLRNLWPSLNLWGDSGDAFALIEKIIEHGSKGNPLLAGVGGVFSFLGDEDPNRARAFTSALVSSYGPYAMLLIPGAGEVAFAAYETVMLVNGAIQLQADAQVASDEIWTNTFVSDPKLYNELTVTTGKFNDNAERIDLSRIPADIGRGVYDYAIQPYATAISDEYNHPSVNNLLRLGAITTSSVIGGPALGTAVAFSLDSTAQKAVLGDVSAIGNDTANVVVGAVQYPVTYFEHNLSYGIANVTVGTSSLPIPDTWKSTILNTSTGVIHEVNELPSLYDVIGLEKPRDY